MVSLVKPRCWARCGSIYLRRGGHGTKESGWVLAITTLDAVLDANYGGYSIVP